MSRRPGNRQKPYSDHQLGKAGGFGKSEGTRSCSLSARIKQLLGTPSELIWRASFLGCAVCVRDSLADIRAQLKPMHIYRPSQYSEHPYHRSQLCLLKIVTSYSPSTRARRRRRYLSLYRTNHTRPSSDPNAVPVLDESKREPVSPLFTSSIPSLSSLPAHLSIFKAHAA